MADNNWVQQRAAAEGRQSLFDALVAFIEENGYSPTRSELAQKTGFSEITARRHIAALKEEGRVTEHGPRTLRPLI